MVRIFLQQKLMIFYYFHLDFLYNKKLNENKYLMLISVKLNRNLKPTYETGNNKLELNKFNKRYSNTSERHVRVFMLMTLNNKLLSKQLTVECQLL